MITQYIIAFFSLPQAGVALLAKVSVKFQTAEHIIKNHADIWWNGI
jgi:hypothetical protein